MIDATALLQQLDHKTRRYRPAAFALVLTLVSVGVVVSYLAAPDMGEATGAASLPARFARGLVAAFGPATFLLALLIAIDSFLHLVGRAPAWTRLRMVSAGAVVVFLPCVFSLLGGESGAAGGAVGLLARDAVLFLFPPLFAVPLLVGMALLALVFATDWLYYERLQFRGLTLPKRKPNVARTKRKSKPVAVIEDDDEYEDDDEADVAKEDVEYEDEEYDDDEYEEEDGEDESDEELEDDELEDEEEEDEEEEEPELEEADLEEPDLEEPEVVEEPVVVPKPRKRASRAKKKTARVSAAPTTAPRKRGKHPLPPIELLEKAKSVDIGRLERAIRANAEILERSLASFRVETRVVGWTRGPVITMYELALKEGIKLTQIVNRADDLAIALKAESVRIVAPIPGKNTVGVEVPNMLRDDVGLRSLVEECGQVNKKNVPIFLGRNAAGDPMIEDLSAMPHLLIAGATGSGKSVCINTIILSVLMTRTMEDVRLILIDPKQVELAFFKEIPHLLTSVVTDARKAAQTLDWVVTEMEDRYRMFALFGVRNIAAYNKLGSKRIKELCAQNDIAEESAPVRMPYLVVVVDELADLIMTGRKEVEQAITRLAQKSRAVGIHTVLATQRPSTDVITGLIKANMPSRASFKVTSKVDSRVVLDQSGAEKLLGRGDMLFLPPRSFHLVRAQGCFVSDEEVREVVDFLRHHGPDQELRELIVKAPTLDERDPREVDDLFESACRIVIESQRGSASLLQRALQIGYTRASRLIDLMRSQGIIGEFKNAQSSDVLMTPEEFEEKYGDPKL